ncbi:hypothetical protein DEU56DRAFT_807534 [Suillus clintonianus]|uniref:uncharacterized protein n=1 Tax=Suillus clintonianus TaxID=1904413 RepID=UPI001B87B8F1|nr:uncharacterized protein DEU56DRAFT_807534 [Suillus clintonianus]KAG2135288.1 hypothetical protein DEU56DRAFT_807534 [Suillus clintonianus]
MKLCSSALPKLAQSLLTQFQKVLWAWDGGDVDKDSTGVTRRAWKLLGVICRIIEPARTYYYVSPSAKKRNLEMCRKIHERARSSQDRLDLLRALQNALHFMFATAGVSRDPAQLWDWQFCPAKQHTFIKCLITCMDGLMPYSLRHVALRAIHSVRQDMTSIHANNDASLRDMVLTELSPAILTAVCPRPGVTPFDNGPDRIFDHRRDWFYLELVFALARNSNWHSHLSEDHHIDRCISMISACRSKPHAFYLAGILLHIASEQRSPMSLDSITEQQWWEVMRSAWMHAYDQIDDMRCIEFLPKLVEGTKRCMQVAAKFDLEQFIRHVGYTLDTLERRDSELGEQGKQGEGVAIAVKELRTVASDMLERLVKSDEVVGLWC